MPVKLFFCYAHEDEPLLNKLKSQLSPLRRQGLIEMWHDRDISAGTEWESEIKEHLNKAQIILLLVSPAFMNSDYCYGIEMKRAIERHEHEEARVIPIILRPVIWKIDPLSKLQALPTDAKPIMRWSDHDAAFYNVAEGIRKTSEELALKQQLPVIPSNPDIDEAPKPQVRASVQSERDIAEVISFPNASKSIKAIQQPKEKMQYNEFRIFVEDLVNLYIFRPHRPSLHGKLSMNPEKRRAINIYSEWLAQGKITNREELILLGNTLYQVLFNEEVNALFKDEWFRIQNQQSTSTGLRLMLEFGREAIELAQMPWEYLYYPDNKMVPGFFLAGLSRLILARYVPSNLSDFNEPEEGPLRVLVVVSQPMEPDLDILDAEPIIYTLKELTDSMPNEIKIQVLTKPTLPSFEKIIMDFRPHVLHFIGHGRYKDTSSWLALLGDDNGAHWISDDTFQHYIGLDGTPRLVFLHASEGALSDSYKAFREMALKLVYSSTTSALIMHYPVENSVASRFTKIFYQSLGQGNRIDEAVQAGRLEIMEFFQQHLDLRAFGSPVVYLRSIDMDSVISIRPAQIAVSVPSKALFPDRVPCPHCGEPTLKTGLYCQRCGVKLPQNWGK